MKNLMITLVAMITMTMSLQAQVKFGVEAGVAPAISPNTHHVYVNRSTPLSEFRFNVTGVNSAIYLGGTAQMNVDDNFFVKVQALYNQKETEYEVNYTVETEGRSANQNLYTERSHQIDLPISLGAELGIVDVNSGFVTHFLVKNSNSMTAVEGFKSSPRKVDFGWQTGLGINISNLRLGVTYQMDFSNYGSHLQVNDSDLALQNSPTRVMATIGYQF